MERETINKIILNIALDELCKIRYNMIKLHYAELNNEGDIPCLDFKNELDFNDFLCSKFSEDRVFLFAFEFSDGTSEVFVTEDLSMVSVIMGNCYNLIQVQNKFFLQEYTSFEEAYKVALDMQETSELCYEK